MKIGLQIPDFSTPRGPERLGPELATVARTADDAGFEYIAVMDHFFQIPAVGPAEREMLEAYTTLGYLAACTSRAALLTVITGTVYRDPGILAKMVTTLDVLSKGRAWLGIGAAWNEQESRGLGIPFPPVAERFERLEETLQICLQMWHGDESPYHGKHYQLERPLNSPQSLSRPHPPIMIGGGGEKKTRATCSPAGTRPASSTCCGSTARPSAATTTRSTRRSTTRSTRPRARSGSSTTSARSPGWASTRRSGAW
jgi:F420-dependent oxidoreductase-like protein